MKNEYFIANGFIKCYSDISANLVYNSIAKHKNKNNAQLRALKIIIMQCLSTSTAAFNSSIPLQIVFKQCSLATPDFRELEAEKLCQN